MANGFYTKEAYIERCRLQRESFGLLANGMKKILASLPLEDGKRFDKRDLEALNKKLHGVWVHFCDEPYLSNRYLWLTTVDCKYNGVINDVRIGSKGTFQGGKIYGIAKLKNELKLGIARYEEEIERYEKALSESQIRLFQARYKAYYEAYKALEEMNMPEVSIEYISELSPVR